MSNSVSPPAKPGVYPNEIKVLGCAFKTSSNGLTGQGSSTSGFPLFPLISHLVTHYPPRTSSSARSRDVAYASTEPAEHGRGTESSGGFPPLAASGAD